MNAWQCALCHLDADGVLVVRTRPVGDLCTDCAATLVRRGLKWCRGCHRAHLLAAFPRDRKTPDGHAARCRAVRAAKAQQWRATHAEATRVYDQGRRARQVLHRRVWARRNPDKVRAQGRRKYWRNPAAALARATAYYAENRERLIARKRERRLEQKRRILAQIRGEA